MITENRNLYSGTPVWQEGRQPEIPHRPLTKNISTDILIIGAGVSGAMMAEALSGHGYDITIVDRRPPLAGSTAATTCLIQYEIDEPLIKLSAKLGEKKRARRGADRSSDLKALLSKSVNWASTAIMNAATVSISRAIF